MENILSIQQIAEASNLSRTQIDQWISRGHFKEHEKVYRSTLGDDEFVSRLANRVGNPPDK